MWTPNHYQVLDDEKIIDFVKSIGLATIICKDESYPIATHTPIELEIDDNGNQVLRGHIAKANPQSKLLLNEPNVLVIFLSPINHYISSSWYEKPTAPTWNYKSVHMYGKVKILNGDELWDSVERLTQRHERISKCPVSLNTLPKNIQGMLRGVAGFEIPIEKIEAAFKLSQNRTEKDYNNIIDELKALNTPEGNQMSKILKNKNKI